MNGLKNTPKVWIAVLAVLLLWPLPLVYLLSARDRHYDQLLSTYECYPLTRCNVDLNNDGVSGKLQLIGNSGFSTGEESVAVIEGGTELLRIPYVLFDDTLRTHIAVIYEAAARSKVVVFQPGGRDLPPTNSVYFWDQGSIKQIRPSRTDEELLQAMAARDGSGTWPQWAFFRFIKVPALGFYYVLFTILLAVLYRLIHRRQLRPAAEPRNPVGN
jgi:hypothetical protein